MRRSIHGVSMLGCALAAMALVAGCGDDGGGGGRQLEAGNYTGLITGPSASGTFKVTLASAGPQALNYETAAGWTISGTMTMEDGTTASLTGTYDAASGTLTFSGGGYSFTGEPGSDGGFSGTFTSPGGSGTFTASMGTAQPYCGTFTGGVSGTFNLLVSGASANGNAYPNGDDAVTLRCTVSGSSMSCNVEEEPQVTVHGTLSGTTWAGTAHDSKNGNDISWSAVPCAGF